MHSSPFLRTLLAHKQVVLAIWLATIAVTIGISLLLPKYYVATTTLLVDASATDSVSGAVQPERSIPNFMATQAEIIASRGVALEVVEQLKLAERADFVQNLGLEKPGSNRPLAERIAEALLGRLEVKPSRESSLLNVTYSERDPEMAAAIVNAFAQTYIKKILELRVGPARQSAAWFDQQIQGLRENLERAQTALTKYQSSNGIVNTDERLDEESARLAGLSSQLVTVQSQTYANLSRQRQLATTGERGSPDSLPEIIANPVIQTLKTELARAEEKLAEASRRLDSNHPQYQRAEAEVSVLKGRIAREVRNATNSIVSAAQSSQQHEADLKRAVELQKEKVLEHQRQRDGVLTLRREVENAQRAYDAGLQRLAQTRLESQSNQTNVVVLTAATPPSGPARPRKLLNLSFAALFGALLAAGVAMLLETRKKPGQSQEEKITTLIRRVT